MNNLQPIDEPHVPSGARLAANRANALKSTGPRTGEGKAKSRLNALRHGITAQVTILPGEDSANFAEFIRLYHQDLGPKGMLEVQLVQTIAEAQWRLNRFRGIENSLFALGHNEHASTFESEPEIQTALAAAVSINQHANSLKTLGLHEQRTSRQFHHALKALTDIQTKRKAQEEAELGRAMLIRTHTKEKDLPLDFASLGFVLTLSEIDRRIRHDKAYEAAMDYRDEVEKAEEDAEEAKEREEERKERQEEAQRRRKNF